MGGDSENLGVEMTEISIKKKGYMRFQIRFRRSDGKSADAHHDPQEAHGHEVSLRYRDQGRKPPIFILFNFLEHNGGCNRD